MSAGAGKAISRQLHQSSAERAVLQFLEAGAGNLLGLEVLIVLQHRGLHCSCLEEGAGNLLGLEGLIILQHRGSRCSFWK